MTALQRPRIVFHDTEHGDDQLGDGSFDCPVRSYARAEELKKPGDEIASDYVLKSQPTAPRPVPAAPSRGTDWAYVGCWIVCLALVAFVCAAIAAKTVGL